MEFNKVSQADALLKRAFMFLEDGDWSSADNYCERVLDIDPESAPAYIGKLCAELHVVSEAALVEQMVDFSENANFKKALRFANEEYRETLLGYGNKAKIRHNDAAKKAEYLAEMKAKRNKKIAIVGILLVGVASVFFALLKFVIIPNAKYNEAVALMEAGNYRRAIASFENLGNYKDSVSRAKMAFLELKKLALKDSKVGDYVTFGFYEQDNNMFNGKEAIEWRVLDVKEGRVLIISKYALDCMPYNNEYADVTWETCSLRKWLNNEFLSAAFSTEERTMIPTVTVSADKNPSCSTNPGKATQDQVFLLSLAEVNAYYGYDATLRREPTAYALENGASANSYYDSCCWWLRSPGDTQSTAVFVSAPGLVAEDGMVVTWPEWAVCPAMWIEIGD